MREITLLLVLANLAFLAWGMWIAPDDSAPRVSPNAREHIARLVLASEEAAERGTEAVQPPDGDAVFPPASDGAAVSRVGDSSAGQMEQPASFPEQAASAGAIPVAQEGEASPPGGEAEADAGVQTVALAAPAPAPRCVSIGPFLDLAETAEAAARLREKGYAPRQRLAESPVWMGHWVYLAAFPTRAQAVAAVDKLRTQGVQDLHIEAGGADENAVSLGLFGDRERAEAQAGAIRNLGYAPQIGDKFRLASVYWVEVVLPPETGIEPAEYQTRPGRILREEEHACPEGTVAPIFVNSEEQE